MAVHWLKEAQQLTEVPKKKQKSSTAQFTGKMFRDFEKKTVHVEMDARNIRVRQVFDDDEHLEKNLRGCFGEFAKDLAGVLGSVNK